MIWDGMPTDEEILAATLKRADEARRVRAALIGLLDFLDRASDYECAHANQYRAYQEARAALSSPHKEGG